MMDTTRAQCKWHGENQLIKKKRVENVKKKKKRKEKMRTKEKSKLLKLKKNKRIRNP
jgi:hypothetical protein